MNKLKTNWFQWYEITIKMNLWETTYGQESFHNQSFTLIWSHLKMSGLIEGYEEVDNKIVSIKWNSTEDGSMRDNQLTTIFSQIILEIDLEP